MRCGTCGQEIMEGAAFCPYCGGKVARGEPGEDAPVYQAEVKKVLKSGRLIVYRDRTEFVTSSVQKATFSYQDLVAVKKEWDHIDFITGDGRRESCPADRKCVHEAFLYIERMARPYLDKRKDQLLSQGIRYSFPSSQGMLNDGVLELSHRQAEFKGRSGKGEVISFQEVKSVSAPAGTLDLLLFDRRTRSFSLPKELRDEVLAFVAASIAPFLAQRRQDLLARGIYFSFYSQEGGTVDFLADRVERQGQAGRREVVFFRDVRAAVLHAEMLELALTNGVSAFFSIDPEDGGEVLAFVTDAIQPYVRARTEGFDTAFGLDERIEINEARGVFHILRQGGKEITGEWPLEAVTQCRWEESRDLNALGSVVSGGIALFKSAARVKGNQNAAEAEERIGCAGVAVTFRDGEEPRTQQVWFGVFPAGMSRSSKKFEPYLAEWTGLSDFLAARCPGCELIAPAPVEPEPQLPEPPSEPETDETNGLPKGLPAALPFVGAAEPEEEPDAEARQDDLGVAKYIDGIAIYIRDCRTPAAVAFQGNRGSEENSLLRMLFRRLEEQGETHRLWLNVRQFSQGETGDALTVQLGKKLVSLFSDGEAVEKGGVIISALAGAVTAKIVGDSSLGKDMVSGLLGKPATDTPEQLAELLSRKAGELAGDGKVVLFLDGLDRFSPGRTVELLEAMRDLFACKSCVFVVAADYSVVLTGLRERYGQGYEESRARTFFDQLFKMSFRIPASSFHLESYVKSKLEQMDLSVDDEEADLYAALTQRSVGKDLERVDRLFASYQLTKNMADPERFKVRYNRLALFALLCMQAGFRGVYDCVMGQKDSITPEFLAGLCGCSSQPWGAGQISDGERAAFQGFGGVLARIINQDGDMEISQTECRAFLEALELSSVTSR